MFSLNNKKTRSIITQIGLLILLIALTVYFVGNVIDNLQRLGVSSGFDFLQSRAGYDLFSPIIEYTAESKHLDAYFVGLLNTILVSIFGIFFATVLGFLLGILRLSDNWIVNKTVYWIVEFSRNIPVLIWIIIWYFGVFLKLPSSRQAINFFDSVFISNRGLYVPKAEFQTGAIFILGAFLLGLYLLYRYVKKSRQIQDETGEEKPVFKMGILYVLGLPIIAYFLSGQPIDWSYPTLRGFNFRGGMALKPEFVSLLVGLSVYTAANIAENVRAGIVSVPKGQIEAGKSLNITQWQLMKKIIIPQALRVIIPPLNSQYLNLVKNSSLAIAIGYTDIVATIGGVTLNQTGQALECIAIIMGTYLIMSLLISSVMNYINKRVQITTR